MAIVTNSQATSASKYPKEVQAPRYKGSGFTNTEDVLDASASPIGMQQSLLSKMAEQKRQQLGQLGQAKSAFEQSQNQNNLGSAQNLERIGSTLNTILDTPWNQTDAKPIDVSPYQSMFNRYNTAAKPEYVVPKYAESKEYSKLSDAVKSTKAFAKPVDHKTYQPILSQTFGSNKYGQGASTLDQALLNKNANVSKALQGNVVGVGKQAEQTLGEAQRVGERTVQDMKDFGTKYKGLFDTATNKINEKTNTDRQWLEGLAAASGENAMGILDKQYSKDLPAAQQVAQKDALAKLQNPEYKSANEADGKFTYKTPDQQSIANQMYNNRLNELQSLYTLSMPEDSQNRQLKWDVIGQELAKMNKAYGTNLTFADVVSGRRR